MYNMAYPITESLSGEICDNEGAGVDVPDQNQTDK
jgi:hypothetical protein